MVFYFFPSTHLSLKVCFVLHIIDRYILKFFLLFFILSLLVFVSLFFSVDFMSTFIQKNIGLGVVARYYLYQTPDILHQMIPIASLMATVFTLSSLNRSNELIALFSLGMSLARVSAPVLGAVAVISTLGFWVGNKVLPKTNQMKNYIYFTEVKKKPSLYSTIKTNKIWYRSENILFNIKTLNASAKRAEGLNLYYFDKDWNLSQLITAESMIMKPEFWELENGKVTLFTKDSSFPLTKNFKQKTVKVNEDIGDLQSSAASSDVLSLKDLNKFISKNKEAGLDTLHYEVDYHSKFSFAFAAFVMSLLGIPFSVKHQRSGGTLANVGICILLAFIYWSLYSSFLTMGKHSVLPPLLAAWLPNVIMVGASLFFLFKLKK